LHERLSGVSGNEEDDFEKCMDDELTLALDAYIKGFDKPNNEATKSSNDMLKTENTQEIQENQTGNKAESTLTLSSQDQNADSSNKAAGGKDKNDEYYDDIYFSSGSSEDMSDVDFEERKQRKKSKRKKLTNDELLYDPNMDKEDEKWVNRQRMAYHNGNNIIVNSLHVV